MADVAPVNKEVLVWVFNQMNTACVEHLKRHETQMGEK